MERQIIEKLNRDLGRFKRLSLFMGNSRLIAGYFANGKTLTDSVGNPLAYHVNGYKYVRDIKMSKYIESSVIKFLLINNKHEFKKLIKEGRVVLF